MITNAKFLRGKMSLEFQAEGENRLLYFNLEGGSSPRVTLESHPRDRKPEFFLEEYRPIHESGTFDMSLRFTDVRFSDPGFLMEAFVDFCEQHSKETDHGFNCACMDVWIQRLRTATQAGGTLAQQRIDHVLRVVSSGWRPR